VSKKPDQAWTQENFRAWIKGVRTKRVGCMMGVFVDGVLVSEHGTVGGASEEAARLRADKSAQAEAVKAAKSAEEKAARGARWVLDKCENCHGSRGGVPGNENIVNGKILCDYCSLESEGE
jgi:hypothetical protein